ncbi:hypothetical protein SNEBB_006751 [Seison nebaliae]|nr:hypothetical protein SNEBB_006751 [Seison nebaliae]
MSFLLNFRRIFFHRRHRMIWRRNGGVVSNSILQPISSTGNVLQNLDAKDIFNRYRLLFEKELKEDEKKKEEEKNDSDSSSPPPIPPALRLLSVGLLGMVSYYLLQLLFMEEEYDESNRIYVSWNEFHSQMLSKGEVQRIVVHPEEEVAIVYLHPGAILHGKKTNRNIYLLRYVNLEQFEHQLQEAEKELGINEENRIQLSYKRQSSFLSIALMFGLFFALYLLGRNIKIQMPNSMNMMGGMTKAKYQMVGKKERQSTKDLISFKDVAGLNEAKEEVKEFVDYLQDSTRFTRMGAKIPKGALLLGPPGCGKTLLARAIANEASVPFLSMAGSEFVEMIGGLGAARVRSLFDEARKKAPCIIYIDEIDAIGRKRNSDANQSSASGEEEHTLNQLLTEMDGIQTDKADNVIVIGSTNRSEILDKALLRPGRFDRHINIDYPTKLEREEIIQVHLRPIRSLENIKLEVSKRLSLITPGMSGADLANICNEAALMAARQSKSTVELNDFDQALERFLIGSKRNSRLSLEERHSAAIHQSSTAIVRWFLPNADLPFKLSLLARNDASQGNVQLGSVRCIPQTNLIKSKEQLKHQIASMLAGRLGEIQQLNKLSTANEKDLKRATKMAYDMVQVYGMSKDVGSISFPPNSQSKGKTVFSKKLKMMIDNEVRRLLLECEELASSVLSNNVKLLNKLTDELIRTETLSYEDIEKVLGKPPNETKRSITSDQQLI